jgi:hypothetical protein
MISHGDAARIAKDIYHPLYHPRQAGITKHPVYTCQ